MNRLNALDYVAKNIERLHFNSIIYSPELEIEEGILEFTQENQPISMGYDYVFKNYLGINGKYYLDNKREVNKYLCEIGRFITTEYLVINKQFVTEKLKKAVLNPTAGPPAVLLWPGPMTTALPWRWLADRSVFCPSSLGVIHGLPWHN